MSSAIEWFDWTRKPIVIPESDNLGIYSLHLLRIKGVAAENRSSCWCNERFEEHWMRLVSISIKKEIHV